MKERLELALFNGLLKTIQPTLEAVLHVIEKIVARPVSVSQEKNTTFLTGGCEWKHPADRVPDPFCPLQPLFTRRKMPAKDTGLLAHILRKTCCKLWLSHLECSQYLC